MPFYGWNEYLLKRPDFHCQTGGIKDICLIIKFILIIYIFFKALTYVHMYTHTTYLYSVTIKNYYQKLKLKKNVC